MSHAFDAIIIGAGPAGASAAILLATAGWSVALVEKQAYPRRKVCGECIAAPNLELLDALGIGPAFHGIAGPALQETALMCGGRVIRASLPRLQDSTHPWGKALGREILDTLLVERAQALGAAVYQPWSARTLLGSPGKYRCQVVAAETHDVQELAAPVLIAAHGSWSGAAIAPGDCRHPMDATPARPPPRADDLFAFKANFLDADPGAGVISLLTFRGGYGGMVLGEAGVTTLACCVRRDALVRLRRELKLPGAGAAVEAALRQSCSGVDAALSGARRRHGWLAVGPIRPGIRVDRPDQVLSIGNAAGEAHPIVGEGISMALQSAWLLCQQLLACRRGLADGSAHAEVRRGYVQQWKQCFLPRMRLAHWCAQAAMRPHLLAGALPLLQRWPALLTAGASLAGKTRRIRSAPAAADHLTECR